MTGYYCEGAGRAEKVRRLFAAIARRYDFLNDLQSAGMHRLWKRRLVNELRLKKGERVLDLACGTGDLVFRALDRRDALEVIGGDLTLPMLRKAQERSRPFSRSVQPAGWIQLDGQSLPFAADMFDAVMMAYGLRNMADPAAALREIARVLKHGGRVAILDFGRPVNPLLKCLYFVMLRVIQPVIGWIFFRDSGTYRYIHESLARYPAQEGVSRLLEENGFREVTCCDIAWGAMSLHRAVKRVAFDDKIPA